MAWVWGIGIVTGLMLLIAAFAIPLAARWQRGDARRAIRTFHKRRELLEAKFFDRAQSLGKPRGLRWLDCEWFDDVTFGARQDDRATRSICRN